MSKDKTKESLKEEVRRIYRSYLVHAYAMKPRSPQRELMKDFWMLMEEIKEEMLL